MARTVEAYRQRWQDALGPSGTTAPWDEDLTPTACVIYESARSTPMGEGCNHFPDFGDAICFYRFYRVPEELDTASPEGAGAPSLLPGLGLLEASWQRYRSRFSDDEIRQRRATAERELDALLVRFVEFGYQSEMDDQLIEIVNSTLIDFELHEVYVLPGDLRRLLDDFGNPLVDPDAEDEDEDEVAAMAAAPFDLSNAAHRKALEEMLGEIGR